VDSCSIDVLVTPRASKERIGPMVGGRLKISVTAAPVDGEANRAVIEALAKALRCPKSRISVVRGESSRKKTVRVEGVSEEAIRALIR
jgi:uncharacterized protein (TIGR00251 family)